LPVSDNSVKFSELAIGDQFWDHNHYGLLTKISETDAQSSGTLGARFQFAMDPNAPVFRELNS
jgi:hypothetical protein